MYAESTLIINKLQDPSKFVFNMHQTLDKMIGIRYTTNKMLINTNHPVTKKLITAER